MDGPAPNSERRGEADCQYVEDCAIISPSPQAVLRKMWTLSTTNSRISFHDRLSLLVEGIWSLCFLWCVGSRSRKSFIQLIKGGDAIPWIFGYLGRQDLTNHKYGLASSSHKYIPTLWSWPFSEWERFTQSIVYRPIALVEKYGWTGTVFSDPPLIYLNIYIYGTYLLCRPKVWVLCWKIDHRLFYTSTFFRLLSDISIRPFTSKLRLFRLLWET